MGERITVDAAAVAEVGSVLELLSGWMATRAAMARSDVGVRLEGVPGTRAHRELMGDWERAQRQLCTELDELGRAARTAGGAYVAAESRASTFLTYREATHG